MNETFDYFDDPEIRAAILREAEEAPEYEMNEELPFDILNEF